MQNTTNFQRIVSARRSFFERGRLPRGLVPDAIARSWQRCASLGLREAVPPSLEPLTAHELREACERSGVLRRSCRPELEALHAEARRTDSIVILTDADGMVLDSIGDADFADRAARVALRPGVPWRESSTGTNAVGTALVERRPVEVRGAEHYFQPHRILSCFAAPIIDPTGNVAGALDLSGHASVPHLHALGMVRFAVDQIEHRWFDQRFADCEVLRLHADPSLIGTAQEGILVFRDYRLVAANRHGLRLLQLDWDALRQTRFGDLFSSPLSQLRRDGQLRDHHGRALIARLDESGPRIHVRPAQAPEPGPINADTLIVDRALQRNVQRAARMLDAGLPVLLQGETGTGKEVFARQLHAASARAHGPLVAVNCAALPESLIEAELFGYEEGAFTGARRRGSAGLLRRADGGVLFLDEIGDMPLALQSRLLRVLQEREVLPLGGQRPVPVDFTLICASHCPLDDALARRNFRADLYYRIAQYVVALAPLRAHAAPRELVCELWDALAPDTEDLPTDVLDALAAHPWPGNYRELSACLRMLKVLAGDGLALSVDDLPPGIRRTPGPRLPLAAGELGEIAESAMRAALDACQGNVSAAARKLGVSRSTLYRRVLASKTTH